MIKIGVLGSGSGSNFATIAESIQKGSLTGVEVAVVITDVADAKILERAQKYNIKGVYMPADDYKTKLDGPQEDAYIELLEKAEVDYIVLAGFMRMIKPKFLKAFAGKIINIHPSLLPAFPGLASWKQALEYGAKYSGCTVHFVDAGMDTGPIITQAAVEIKADDTAETLHARVQVQEHRLYPQVLQWLADDKLVITGRKVLIKD